MRFRSSFVCFGIYLVACATAPEIPLCPPRQEQEPSPARQCLEQEEGQSYIGQAASGLAKHLMGWRSHPGAATVSIGFADDSTVESVCLRDASGDVVGRRARRAAADLWRLPAAPACFAKRRVDFAWESPIVTGEGIRVAKAECKGEAAPPKRAVYFCRFRQDCAIEELRRLRDEADRALSECVLRKVPISLRVSETEETVYFLPSIGTSPDAKKALDALAACENPEDRPSLIACMLAEGWEPVE